MKNIIILILAALAVAIALVVSKERQPQTEISRTQLVPGLLDQVNRVTSLEIRSRTEEVVLNSAGDQWTVGSQHDYPSDFQRIKNLILEVADAEIIEPKTSDPERYSRIGVQDLSIDDSAATQLTLKDGEGLTIADLLVGTPRRGAGPTARYIRKVGDAQSFLVTGNFDVSPAARDWMDRNIINIEAERVKRVEITPSGQPSYQLDRDDPQGQLAFAVMPEGYEDKSPATTNSIGTFLSSLRFDEVIPASSLRGTPDLKVRFVTIDGIEVNGDGYSVDESVFVKFSFAFNQAEVTNTLSEPEDVSEPDGQDDVPILNPTDPSAMATAPIDGDAWVSQHTAKLDNWAFRVPSFKLSMINRTKAQLIQLEAKEVDVQE